MIQHSGKVRLFGAMLAGAIALSASPTLAKDKIVMAIPTFLTGAGAPGFGIPGKQGAELMIEAINAGTLPAPYNEAPYDRKGLAGAQIQPLFYDEAGGNTKQVTELRNKVQKENVDMVLGYVSSGSCVAAAPVAEQLKVLTILAVCGTPRIFEEIVPNTKYVFRPINHSSAINISAALYVAAKYKNARTYTGINQNYAMGQDSWRDFKLAMDVVAPKAKLAGNPLFPKLFSGQYGAEISTLLRSDADVVLASLWGGDLEALILQGGARGLFDRGLYIFTFGDTAAYGLGKKFPMGEMVGNRGPYSIAAVAIHTPLNDWFQKAFRAKYKTQPSQPAYQYAQAVLATKAAFDRAAAKAGQFPTTDQVIDAMTGMEFQSLTMTVKFALSHGHQAVHEDMWGVTAWDEKLGEPVVQDIMTFPVDCVMPPDGVPVVEWLKNGMKGSSCL